MDISKMVLRFFANVWYMTWMFVNDQSSSKITVKLLEPPIHRTLANLVYPKSMSFTHYRSFFMKEQNVNSLKKNGLVHFTLIMIGNIQQVQIWSFSIIVSDSIPKQKVNIIAL